MSSIAPDRLFSILGQPKASDDPRREILIGGGVAAVFFVGVLGWASITPMDAAATASGVVVVAGHRQAIQASESGVISSVDVKDGDRVTAGQPLVEFASAEARSEESALAARVIGLEAHLARLNAEKTGQAAITPPADFAALPPEDQPIAAEAMATETTALRAARAEDAARHALLRQHAVEAGQQIAGYQHQLDANQRQHALNDQELKGMQELAAKGYAPMTRVLALEHTAASLEGDAGAQQAEIARLRSVAGESQLQILQGDNDKAQQTDEDVRKTEADLEQAQPELQTAREHLEHTRVRAPVSGSIVGLAVNSVNGVVAPGEKMMEVVPDKLPLVIEAQVSPRDANDLKVGQTTQVRFPSLHSRRAPIIHGTLTRISADSVVDEKTGRAYFTADVTVAPSELARLSDVGGEDAMRPGMPADVVAPTRKRTALQYWLEPLTQTLWRSFREP